MHASKKINQQLHTALYNKTIQIVEATGLPFFIVDKTKQAGKGFGENLADAIDSVFNRNYSAVITIGNDSPQLSTATLLDAAKKVNLQQLVLGPDRNGGIYLLGITSKLFKAKSISTIPWQTKNVFASLLQYQDSIGNDSAILPILSDFNKLSDYYFFKNILRPLHGFIKLITTIITGETIRTFLICSCIYRFRFLTIKQLRAPPFNC